MSWGRLARRSKANKSTLDRGSTEHVLIGRFGAKPSNSANYFVVAQNPASGRLLARKALTARLYLRRSDSNVVGSESRLCDLPGA